MFKAASIYACLNLSSQIIPYLPLEILIGAAKMVDKGHIKYRNCGDSWELNAAVVLGRNQSHSRTPSIENFGMLSLKNL